MRVFFQKIGLKIQKIDQKSVKKWQKVKNIMLTRFLSVRVFKASSDKGLNVVNLPLH